MSVRIFALVGKMEGPPRVKHYRGLPPELTEGRDERAKLPWPHVLVIEEKPDGFFLFRLVADGSVAGDTWHMSLDDAKQQAEYEYGEGLGEWKHIPEDVADIVDFAIAQTP
jgi:hypothetical protein